MFSKTVDLSKIRDIDLDSITMRTVNGDDTLDAASRCIPPDGASLDMNVFSLMMRQQVMLQSITSYTLRADKKVVTCVAPPIEATKWTNRTRDFVGEIYDYLNSVAQDERENFRKALTGNESTPGSSDAVRAESTTVSG